MNDPNYLKNLRDALKFSPENVPLLKMFGQACLEQWSLVEGREVFEKILKLSPNDLDAKLGVAAILYQMGKISEAMVRTEAITIGHPNFAQGWILLSKLQISEGKKELAREYYEKARAIDPNISDGVLDKELNITTTNKDALRPQAPEKLANVESGWRIESEIDEETGAFATFADSPVITPENFEKPTVNFNHVGGMHAIKEEIKMKIIYPLQNPDLFKAYGKKTGGGVLLYGPPGCGKTLISRATAGEINAHFISIALHQILDMYIGNSEKNLHDLFELARAHKPCVLFIDEIDALAADRKDLKQSAARTLINQFLAEMDGDIASNDGVLILGATNAPWHIDPAFRRPGRFDRIIFVPTPDEGARAEIIKILAHDKPISEIDVKALAQKTPQFSGADIKAVFDQAVELSLARAMKENRIVPLTTNDFLKSAKNVVPSSRAWFESAKNYALYANQSGMYDPILNYLGIKK